jgi:hypothetical protein
MTAIGRRSTKGVTNFRSAETRHLHGRESLINDKEYGIAIYSTVKYMLKATHHYLIYIM